MPKFTLNPAALTQLVDNTQTSILPNKSLKQLTQICNLEPAQFWKNREIILSLLESISSLDCTLFVNVLRKLLLACTLEQNQIYLDQICGFVVKLCHHHYDQQQVLVEMKRHKDIDPVFVLALLWKFYQSTNPETGQQKCHQRLIKIIKVINLIVTSYPVDLILHGTPYLKKWNNLLQEQIGSINTLNELRNSIDCLVSNRVQGQSVDKKTGQVRYNLVTFSDIYIPL